MLNCHRNNPVWSFALALLVSWTLAGCQNIESASIGYKAKEKNIIQLTNTGSQQGTWKTSDVNLNYQYEYTDDLLRVSGTIDLSSYYDLNFSVIRTLDVYLFFLNDKSIVLATEALVKTLPMRTDQTLKFAKEIVVPTDSRAIIFGYSGEATGERGSRPGKGGLGFFSNMPQRPR